MRTRATLNSTCSAEVSIRDEASILSAPRTSNDTPSASRPFSLYTCTQVIRIIYLASVKTYFAQWYSRCENAVMASVFHFIVVSSFCFRRKKLQHWRHIECTNFNCCRYFCPPHVLSFVADLRGCRNSFVDNYMYFFYFWQSSVCVFHSLLMYGFVSRPLGFKWSNFIILKSVLVFILSNLVAFEETFGF